MRDWFWELEAAGHGPDWFFFATLAPAASDRLRTIIRTHPLPGFAVYQVSNGLCSRHQHISSYELYIDEHSYAALVASFEGQSAENSWIYHTIAVCGADLTVERGYGGYPGSHGAAETSLIARLAAAPELAMLDWSVAYGGAGYDAGQVASGRSGAELLAYLREA